MRLLWAPWRVEYIRQPACKRAGCIFCRGRRAKDDRKYHVVHRGELALAMLNAYPYNTGHLMVAPNRHVGDLERLSEDELAGLMLETRLCIQALRKAFKPEAFNVGLNLGQVAGAGIVDHLHVHVVPRWAADTNFMPILTDTRVIPEALERTYDAVVAALGRLSRA